MYPFPVFLIVGLGNPGLQYARTRHNAGWFVIDELARRHEVSLVKKNADYKLGLGMIGEHKIGLVKPQTYMNESGRAVASLKHFYRLEVAQILVLTDDLNLPLGKLRLRGSGSDGGHNGLKSIAGSLGSREYARLRIGVGEPPREERERAGTANFVLRPFGVDEWPLVEEITARAADCAQSWIENGVAETMTRFNG